MSQAADPSQNWVSKLAEKRPIDGGKITFTVILPFIQLLAAIGALRDTIQVGQCSRDRGRNHLTVRGLFTGRGSWRAQDSPGL